MNRAFAQRRSSPIWTLLALAMFTAAAVRADDFPPELIHWKPVEANPVFKGAGDGAWDKLIRERGFILVEDGLYHLWYTGYNPERSATKFLGYATSKDGLTWSRSQATPIFDQSWVEDMCVVHVGPTYFLFAEGLNDRAKLLTSTDRIHWTERGTLKILDTQGRPIPEGPYGTPTVWVEGDSWSLFYERGDLGVWLARPVSDDHLVWKNVQDDPVLKMGPEPYDQAAVAMNQIVKRGDVYYAIYHANSQRPWKDWTTCIARSKDLVHWEKARENPIIQSNSSSGILVETGTGLRLYTMHPEVRAHVSSDAKLDK